jgi:hypothetical protein
MGHTEKHDGKAWRARADECRAIADTFENHETRAKMYQLAADYERMAENADRRHGKADAREGARGASRSGGVDTAP